MNMLRTNNPVLNERAFDPDQAWGNLERDAARPKVMTLNGTILASLVLLGLSVATAVVCWTLFQQQPGLLLVGTMGGSLLGLVLTMICCFKPAASPFLATPVAICQGALAGGLSVFWSGYVAAKSGEGVVGSLGTGLVLQASILTVGVAACMLIAYATRLIRATERFKLGVVAATGGILLLSLASMVLRMFGVQIPFLWDNGPIGIGFAGVVVVIAALNLVLDFDFIEQGVEAGLPRHMEWYAGIGLLVTLVWLYVSILRLLAMLSSRR